MLVCCAVLDVLESRTSRFRSVLYCFGAIVLSQASGLFLKRNPGRERRALKAHFHHLLFFLHLSFVRLSLIDPVGCFSLQSVPFLIYLPSFCCRATAGPGRRRSSWAWSCATTASCITVLVPLVATEMFYPAVFLRRGNLAVIG